MYEYRTSVVVPGKCTQMYLDGIAVRILCCRCRVPRGRRCTSWVYMYLDGIAAPRNVGVEYLVGVDVPRKCSCTS